MNTLSHRRSGPSLFGRLARGVLSALGAVVATLGLFLLLPVLQAVSRPLIADMSLVEVDVASLPPPPPPPPPEEEKKEEEKEEEPQPELAEEQQHLDLEQMELALTPGFGSGGAGGDFLIKINAGPEAGEDVDALFSTSDLDQQPRAMHQPPPAVTPKMRARAPGTVHVIFTVDQTGRVDSALVQRSTDPIFDGPALAAVKQWRFEPGRRNGQPVRFRMRVPITFPKD